MFAAHLMTVEKCEQRIQSCRFAFTQRPKPVAIASTLGSFDSGIESSMTLDTVSQFGSAAVMSLSVLSRIFAGAGLILRSGIERTDPATFTRPPVGAVTWPLSTTSV